MSVETVLLKTQVCEDILTKNRAVFLAFLSHESHACLMLFTVHLVLMEGF